MFDLNKLIESDNTNPWVITDAMGINNNGTIVAYGYKQGEFVGTTLLLSQNNVPEPATTALLLLGFLGIAWTRASRRQDRL